MKKLLSKCLGYLRQLLPPEYPPITPASDCLPPEDPKPQGGMLGDVILEEYTRIGDEAGRRKKGVDYIAGLVQKNHERLVGVVGSDDPRKLYEFVEKALKDTRDNNRPACVSIFYANDLENIREAVSLGWIKAWEDQFTSFKYTCHLTNLGEEIVKDFKRSKES